MFKIILIGIGIFIQSFCSTVLAADSQTASSPSAGISGEINAADINIRSDASTGSAVICKTTKKDIVAIISEKYDWLKIRLPKNACVYAKKSLFTNISGKTAIAAKDKINVRLEPNEASMILGKISKDEVVNVKADKGDWLQIEPTFETYGWINKKFVDKLPEKPVETKIDSQNAALNLTAELPVVLEGTVMPYGKVIKRTATHKLITKDNIVYLLKGNKHNLNSLLRRNVKVTGKQTPSSKKEKFPIIIVEKMEALD